MWYWKISIRIFKKHYRKEFGLDLELEWSQDGCCDLLSDDGSGLHSNEYDFVYSMITFEPNKTSY